MRNILLCGCMVLSLLWPGSTVAQALGDSPHLAQHRDLLRHFGKLLESDPAGAMNFARTGVDNARRLPANDPRRGDALELLGLAHQRAEDFAKALPLALAASAACESSASTSIAGAPSSAAGSTSRPGTAPGTKPRRAAACCT